MSTIISLTFDLFFLNNQDVIKMSDVSVGGVNRDVVVGSVYLPYNDQEPPPSKELVNLVQFCATQKLPLIVGCDANSHHTCWGISDTNSRGNALLDYLVTTELDIFNAGVKPMFVMARQQEVIDISLATADIVTDVISWRVSEEESLSDHRYIKFQTRLDHPIQPYWRNPGAT